MRGAPVVYVADFMDTADGAVRRAAFRGEELALDVIGSVVGKRNAWVAALLAAVVHQAVLADVQVTRAGAAAPIVGFPLGNGGLKVVESRIVDLFPPAHFFVHDLFVGLEGLELASPS